MPDPVDNPPPLTLEPPYRNAGQPVQADTFTAGRPERCSTKLLHSFTENGWRRLGSIRRGDGGPWDRIVDTAGALVICLLGWRFLHRGENDGFLQRWIREFIVRNPSFFSSKRGTDKGAVPK